MEENGTGTAGGMNFDKIDSAILQHESEDNQSQAEQEQKEFKTKDVQIDVHKIIYELETIGNRYLSKIHNDLSFSDDEINFHSELLSTVLKKHFSLEQIHKTPEYFLIGYSSLMALQVHRKYEQLKESGEIEK